MERFNQVKSGRGFEDNDPLLDVAYGGPRTADPDHADGFGKKTIGPWGSIILIFNNLSGPGVVAFPLLFQQAGWLVPTITMLWIAITSYLASSMVCEAMRYYPKNKGYCSRIEFSTLCKFYFGNKFYMFTLFVFIISLQSVNVTGIIETAQVMDRLILTIFHKTGAIEFFPHPGWAWATAISSGSSCFPDGTYVLSLGFLLTVALIIPLGYFNLDDNMIVQKGAFLIACLIFVEWSVVFVIQLTDGEILPLPLLNYHGNAAPVFGTIMFNYAMVITVPSWCNEKTHSTSVNRSLSTAILSGTILFLLIGILGCQSYHIDPEGDLLAAIDSSPQSGIISKISVFLFPISVVATSIPIYSIIVRYNLLENKICNKHVANFIAVILPWLVTIPFYTGSGLIDVINWSSLVSNGIINFIIPFWLYIEARHYKFKELSEFDRADMDEQFGEEYKEPDTYCCFGKLKVQGESPAPPHYAFGSLFHEQSITPKIIALTFMVSLSIALVGVIIINILSRAHIR